MNHALCVEVIDQKSTTHRVIEQTLKLASRETHSEHSIMTLEWNWYLLEVWPRMMETAEVEIVGRDVEFYCPQTWLRKRVENSYQAVPSPLLPGNYAFVRLSSDPTDPAHIGDQIDAIHHMRGVHRVLKGAGGNWAKVHLWEINDLKHREAETKREASRANGRITPAKFKPDTPVRIMGNGNFEGLIGKYLWSARGMATVALENGIRTSIPEIDLCEISDHVMRRRA